MIILLGNISKFTFQFLYIKCKMPKSQLLIGQDTSFKNWQTECSACNQFGFYPPAFCLYICENVEKYGWPLRQSLYKLYFEQFDKTLNWNENVTLDFDVWPVIPISLYLHRSMKY